MKLSDREWAVLNVLWDSGGAGLGELVRQLRPETGWSRNTVLTYLTRMEAKGLVRIDAEAILRAAKRMLPDEVAHIALHILSALFVHDLPDILFEELKFFGVLGKAKGIKFVLQVLVITVEKL